MPGGGGSRQDPSPDQLALIIIGGLAVAMLIARREAVLGALGRWLQDHRLLLAGSPDGLGIPYLGWLDPGRLMIFTGTVLLGAVTVRVGSRLVGALRR